MKKRVLITNDWHYCYKGPSTIKNYLEIQNERFNLMQELKKELNLTGMIIAGDYSNGGYHDQTKLMSHRNQAEALTEGLEFCDLLIGNHFHIERDMNLEMYLIQPHNEHRPKQYFYASKPIFTTPLARMVDNVQISLFHYNKRDKLYIRERDANAKKHIGIYHDESVLPRSIRANMHLPIEVESDYYKAIYNNIDYAFCAHIHKPFGMQYIKLPEKQVPLYIPGSIAITENSKAENHTHENLLLLEIEGDTFSSSFVEFPTFYEKLIFTEKKEKVEDDVRDYADLGEVIKDETKITFTTMKKKSLFGFLANEKGYSEKSLKAVQLASKGSISVEDAINLYFEEDNEQ